MNKQAMADLVVVAVLALALAVVAVLALAKRAEPVRARVSLVPSWPGLAVAPVDQVAEMRRRLRPGMPDRVVKVLPVSNRRRRVGMLGLSVSTTRRGR